MIILKFLLTLAVSAFVGWCWRAGGSGKFPRFLRELGTGIGYVLILWIWLGLSGWYWYLIIIGLSFIESTYFKAKGSNATWVNWMFCGMLYAVIPLPGVIVHKLWIGFIIRSVILIPIITVWRTLWNKVGTQHAVDWSESGAGFLQILTLPILIIGR